MIRGSAIVYILGAVALITTAADDASGMAGRRGEGGRGGTKIGLGGKDVRVPVQAIRDSDARGAFTLGAGDYQRDLKVDGRERFYEVHVPTAYNRAKAAPLMLIFHGGGGYPGSIRYESGMDAVAEAHGFIVLYAAGTTDRKMLTDRLLIWNDGRGNVDGTSSDVDDVGFVAAVLDDAAKIFNIDAKRVYAAGFSNGAQLTYRLAKQLTSRLAAVATVAGHRPVDDGMIPPPPRPISIMQFSGQKDIGAPYEGGKPDFDAKFETLLLPVEDVIRSWVTFDGCPAAPAEVRRQGKAVMTRYGPGKQGTEVVLWTLEDGGHTWPGGNVLPSGSDPKSKWYQGAVNHDINAAEEMWKFFSRHQLD